MNNQPESIAKRSLYSVSWNVAGNLIQVVIGVLRSILLARLLPVEIFGIYALATSIVRVSGVAARFGMEGAFLHRSAETEDEAQAAAAHFTLKLFFTFLWAVVLVTITLTGFSGIIRITLLIITGTAAILHITQTARLILIRRVVHRRLALISLLDDVISSVIAVWLAFRGATIWALLATNFVTVGLDIILLYLWRPVWRPKLDWSIERMRYFLRFGARNFLATGLLEALDRVDDIWTGFFLGATPLGFYSRAYTFATYPRKIIAFPVSAVAGGTYAELKEDRDRLSKAFFRTNAFLVRTGFLFAGVLTLIAPEFIRLFLGEKWLPMLAAFRLMLVFTLLDPIKATIADLFVAVGRPDQVVKARAIQFITMLIGLFVLGLPLGITGVALAVDLMLVVGIGVLLLQSRSYVDFSLPKLFLVPSLGILSGLILSRATLLVPFVVATELRSAAAKSLLFAVVYLAIFLIFEFNQAVKMLKTFIRSI